MSTAGFRRRSLRRETLYVALLTGVAGLVCVVVASRMDPGSPTVVITNVGSVALTLAIGGFIYEAVLRDSAVGETLHLLSLRESVVNTGLRDLAIDSSLDWREALESVSQVTLVLGSPFGWLEQAWPHILEAGALRKIDITVYLPKAESDAAAVLAARESAELADTKQRLESMVTFLSDSWTNAITGHAPLKPGSRLTIKGIEFWPSFDVVATNNDVFLRLSSLEKRRPGSPVMTLRMNSGVDTFPVAWLKQEVTGLGVIGASWEREVR